MALPMCEKIKKQFSTHWLLFAPDQAMTFQRVHDQLRVIPCDYPIWAPPAIERNSMSTHSLILVMNE
jgi:hypothetical protein